MNKNEKVRLAKSAEYLANTADCGRFGRAFEMACARPKSRKARVSAQGRADVSVRYNGRYVPAECKTNGGRVDDLLNGTNKSKFVIYQLTFVQKHKATKSHEAWEEVRNVPAVIVPTDLFLNMLRECNALKEVAHNGVVDGIAIQPSSKKMFERLTAYVENYELTFDNTVDYESWMFEGVVL